MAEDGLDGLEDGGTSASSVKKVEWAVHCLDY